MEDVQDSIDLLNEFYQDKLANGYKLAEVNAMTLDDLQRLDEIYGTESSEQKHKKRAKKTYIDKAFPFLF